jgi:hypothetical protein
LRFDRREVEKIVVQDFAKLRVPLQAWAAPDHEHGLDARIEQAFAQHALPDHSGCAEQDYLHSTPRSIIV